MEVIILSLATWLAQESTPPSWVTLITQAGAAAALLIVGMFLFQGKLALGREVKRYQEEMESLKQDRDFWRDLVLEQLKNGNVIVESVGTIAEKLSDVTRTFAEVSAHDAAGKLKGGSPPARRRTP